MKIDPPFTKICANKKKQFLYFCSPWPRPVDLWVWPFDFRIVPQVSWLSCHEIPAFYAPQFTQTERICNWITDIRCELLTVPVSIGHGEDSVVAVIGNNEWAVARRRRRNGVVLENTGAILAVSQSQPALRPRDDQVITGHWDGPVEDIGS